MPSKLPREGFAGSRPSVVATVGFKTAVFGATGGGYLVVKRIVGGPYPSLIPLLLLGVGVWATHANLLHMWFAAVRDGANSE